MRVIKDRGSITVEASLVLPMFICAVLSLAFFIKLVYVHEIIQYAVDKSAQEMALTSYIYHVSGIQELHDTVHAGIEEKSSMFGEQVSSIFDTYETLKGLPDAAADNLEQAREAMDAGEVDKLQDYLGQTAEEMGELREKFERLADATGEIAGNPLGELESIAFLVAGGAFEDIKTELCIPVVKLYMRKYLVAGSKSSADARLKALNVVNGLKGLDLSESSFFENENNDIDIVVRYSLDIPLPFKILPRLTIVQRASAKAWLGGDETGSLSDEKEVTSVWAMNNFQRGKAIRAKFGGNLPDKYPVIACFDSGSAIMIKSMDLTTPFYQAAGNVESKINGYAKELAGFQGAKRYGIKIEECQIAGRSLKLVIPENEIKPEVEGALRRCVVKAAAIGVRLEIIRYQKKADASSDKDSP